MMTKEKQLKRKAVATIRHLEALLKLIHTVATGKPAMRKIFQDGNVMGAVIAKKVEEDTAQQNHLA